MIIIHMSEIFVIIANLIGETFVIFANLIDKPFAQHVKVAHFSCLISGR